VALHPVPTSGAAVTTTPMAALAPGYAEAGPIRTLYVAVLQLFSGRPPSGGIYSSHDGGSTWGRVGSPSPLDRGAVAVAAAPDGRLFAGYLGSGGVGLLCSMDGAAWEARCPETGHVGDAGRGWLLPVIVAVGVAVAAVLGGTTVVRRRTTRERAR
jgi:hypothetical protein